jgi:hypothetical protein
VVNKFDEYNYRWKQSFFRIYNRKREQVNKTGKTSLRAMKKDELTEFCWSIIQHYNVAVNRGDELQRQIDYLEKLIATIREQAGNIRTGEGEQTG